jgi:hypothetical protein
MNYIDLTELEMENIKKEARGSIDHKFKVCKLTGEKKTKKDIFNSQCREQAIRLSFDKMIKCNIDFNFRS